MKIENAIAIGVVFILTALMSLTFVAVASAYYSTPTHVTIDDKVCFGYDVYVDGVFQFTEGQDQDPEDGYRSFFVSPGHHIIEMRKDGCSYNFSGDFPSGGTYKKILHYYWCNGNSHTPPTCDNPPIAQFDKSLYCEGDTVHVTVSAPDMENRLITYEINDCSGTGRKSGDTLHGSEIKYTIPMGMSSSCCDWSICFSWNVSSGTELYPCGPECYDFEVCPELKPDLIITDLWWSPEEPNKGDAITFTVQIKNQGSGSAGSSTTNYYIDGSYVGSGSVPALSAGSTSNRTFTGTPAEDKCGDVQVKAVADANNGVDESEEGNNERTEAMSISCDKPDLILSDISCGPDNPEPGDTITFTVKIMNQGDDNAGSSTIKYYIDGSYVGSDSVPALSAGSNSTRTFTWTPAEDKCGDVQVKAVADANNSVDESEEGNNEKLKTLNVVCNQLMEGDVTLDGNVTITDARLIAQYKAGLIILNETQLLCADTTDDGDVTMIDVMHILQWHVDSDGTIGILHKPLWESKADAEMRKPRGAAIKTGG